MYPLDYCIGIDFGAVGRWDQEADVHWIRLAFRIGVNFGHWHFLAITMVFSGAKSRDAYFGGQVDYMGNTPKDVLQAIELRNLLVKFASHFGIDQRVICCEGV